MSFRYECQSCKGTYNNYSPGLEVEYYHACPRETDNPRNENVCTCGNIVFLTKPDKEQREHRGSAIDTPLPAHKNNEKHWVLFPQGNGYSHILANGKGRKKV